MTGDCLVQPLGQQRHAQPYYQEDPQRQDARQEQHLRTLGGGHQPRGDGDRDGHGL